MTEQTDAAEVEDALLSVTWPDGGREGLPTRKTAGMLAPAVLPLIAAAEVRGAQAVLAAVEAALADTEWYCDDDHDWKGKATLVDRLTWLAARAAAAAAGGGGDA